MNIVFEGSEYSLNDLDQLLKNYPESSRLIGFIHNWLNGSSNFQFNTSGSTSTPKTIEVARQQILASVSATTEYLSLNSGHQALLCLDPDFIAAIMMAARCLVVDMNLVIQRPSANPLANLDKQIDFVSLVPFQVYQMIDDGNIQNLNKVRNVLIGGAPLSASAFDVLTHLHANIYVTYGMTETVSHIALMPVKDQYASSSFTVLPNIKIGLDAFGCLNISGAVTNNLLVQTNDMVELVGESQFRWLGRKDAIINSGGVKINPEQLERIISEVVNPKITYIISSMPDEKLGSACILLLEGNSLSASAFKKVQEHVSKTLSKYHSPKTVLTIEQFERTNSGKILRKQTRQKALNIV